MGVNFACQSVLENKGAELRSHVEDLKRMAESLPEVRPQGRPPLLTDRLRSAQEEIETLMRHVDDWLRRRDVTLPRRLDGLAWIVQSLEKAKIENVRGQRFAELLEVLFSALPAELEHHPVDAPLWREQRLLRQAAFARVEDPKIGRIEQAGRLRSVLGQFRRSRRFASGRGEAPSIGAGWPEVRDLAAVARVGPASDPGEAALIDDLITRWLRATVLGGRAWGPGFYGWGAIPGLSAMLLNVAVAGWLARLHAAGRARSEIGIADVRAAVGRVDRTSGRAVWLGSTAERLRLRYLQRDEGLRRLINAYQLTTDERLPDEGA
jgi:hypothetical protein